VSLIGNPQDEAWKGVGFMTAWGITFPLTRKLGLLMNDPMVTIEGLGIEDSRVQEIRAAVLRGEADGAQKGTTAMEKLSTSTWRTQQGNIFTTTPRTRSSCRVVSPNRTSST
jgi:hypothetical protein